MAYREKTQEEYAAFYEARFGKDFFDNDNIDIDDDGENPFWQFVNTPRWVGWHEEERGGTKTKVPYDPRTGRRASSTDPATWGTHAEAEARARRLDDGRKTGCGIVLGIGEHVYLAGVDLDSCLDERGALAPWAVPILDAVGSYTEVSPSGRGRKSFFYIRTGLVQPFLDLIGVEKGAWGCKRGIPGLSGANHGPGVEIYCSHRYFTVTGQAVDGHSVELLYWPQLEALARLIPAPGRGAAGTGNGQGNDARDNSRSGKAWRAAYAYRDTSYEEMCLGLRDHEDPDIRAWVEDKGLANGERELHRLWERGVENADDEDDEPPPERRRPDDNDDGGAEDEKQPNYRYRLAHYDDINLDTTRAYLVHGLIPREGLTEVWGPRKCGKSFFMYDLALHVSLGWLYHGKRVEQSTVIYIAAEGERGLRARKAAFHQHYFGAPRGFADQVRSPPFYLLTTQLDLAKQVDELGRDIDAQIPPGPVGMIVIDTLNRTLGGSENKPEDMKAYITAADKLRIMFQCAVVIIHHSGVDPSHPRGHTSMPGAADASIKVWRDDTKRIIAEVEFMKDGPDEGRFVSTLKVVELGEDEDGEKLTSCVVEEADDEEIIMTGRAAQLSPTQQIAMNELTRAINEEGEVPPETEGIPPCQMCIMLDIWRQYAIKGGISTSDKPNSRRVAFQRASEQLIANGHVSIHGELVWLK